jgi:hypothetical protein
MASFPDRRETLALMASAMALARPASAQSTQIELSLTEARARFFLPVAINGAGGSSFVLDSGSPAHVVSESLSARLNLPVVGRRRLRAFDGDEASSPVVRAERFAVGGRALGPANLVVWPDRRLEGHDGLIGYPLLADGAVLALGAGKLFLGQGAGAGIAVRAEVGRGGAVLIGGLPEADGRFAFDTGAQELTISPAYHARIADNPAYRDAPKIVVRGPSGQPDLGQVLGFRPEALRFGDLVCANPLVRIAQAGDGRDGAFQGVDGLVGVALLRRYVWGIQPGRLSVLSEVSTPLRPVGAPAASGQPPLGAPLAIPAQGGPSPFGGISFGAPQFEPAPAR